VVITDNWPAIRPPATRAATDGAPAAQRLEQLRGEIRIGRLGDENGRCNGSSPRSMRSSSSARSARSLPPPSPSPLRLYLPQLLQTRFATWREVTGLTATA
jgi:hypothetical protein